MCFDLVMLFGKNEGPISDFVFGSELAQMIQTWSATKVRYKQILIYIYIYNNNKNILQTEYLHPT